MEALTPGYKYSLKNFEGTGTQIIQFTQKSVTPDVVTFIEGTTNEEVTEMLIRRLQFLNRLQPCRENAIAITKFEEALMWLEKRTKDRK